MRPLRIALATRRYWPLTGGPATVTSQLAAALAAAGHQPTVITPRWGTDWPDRITHHGATVERLPISARWWANWSYSRRLASWLQRNARQFDLVYVWGLKHDAAAAVVACGKFGIPVILRPERSGLSGDCHWQLAAWQGRRIKYRCMKASAFVVSSPTLNEEVIAAGFVRGRIRLLPPGVAIGPLPSQGDKTLAHERLAECHPGFALPPDARVAVCLGRLEVSQGLDQVLRAWAHIVEQFPQAWLWIAGDGPSGASLAALASALDLRQRVVISSPFDGAADLLAAADVFLATSNDAGTSQALLEAMAAGKPIVASDIPDHRHFLDGGRCGVLSAPTDPTGLSTAILRLLRGGDVARHLARAARERVESEFSLDASLAAHLQLFEELAAMTPQPR